MAKKQTTPVVEEAKVEAAVEAVATEAVAEEKATDTEVAPAAEAVAEEAVEAPLAKVKKAHTNAAMLDWPTDVWGLTKDLKLAIIQVASRVNGHEDKKELVDTVLEVGLDFLQAKYREDNKVRKQKLAEAAALLEAQAE